MRTYSLERTNTRGVSKICTEESVGPFETFLLLPKNRFVGKMRFLHFDFLLKIELLVKHLNFGQKSKSWSKIEIMVKNRNVNMMKWR